MMVMKIQRRESRGRNFSTSYLTTTQLKPFLIKQKRIESFRRTFFLTGPIELQSLLTNQAAVSIPSECLCQYRISKAYEYKHKYPYMTFIFRLKPYNNKNNNYHIQEAIELLEAQRQGKYVWWFFREPLGNQSPHPYRQQNANLLWLSLHSL